MRWVLILTLALVAGSCEGQARCLPSWACWDNPRCQNDAGCLGDCACAPDGRCVPQALRRSQR